jgi:TDG/mug DNA glycosylase family protein
VEHAPSREQVAAADGLTIPDVVTDGLLVLFVGINPGRYSGATGHHFARPGNRFWKALHLGGFTDGVWSPDGDRNLPSVGLGVTNLVGRTTRGADELASSELRDGAERLERLARSYAPTAVAVLGIGAFRTAFARPRATLGEQADHLGPSLLWALPNPSGLNAHHQLDDLGRRFRELRDAAIRSRVHA